MAFSRDRALLSSLGRSVFIATLLAVFLGFLSPETHAQESCFRVLDPVSMNSAGTIAGGFVTAERRSHPFIRARNGTITTFDVDGAQVTFVNDINSAGTITGSYAEVNTETIGNRGYLRAADGSITKFDVPGAYDTAPMAINPAGTIVGSYNYLGDLYRDFAFLRSADGTILTFTVPGSTSQNIPTDINALGAITGRYRETTASPFAGFIREPDGSITTFKVGSDTEPVAINSKGDVAGNASGYGFLRHDDGTVEIIEVPGSTLTHVEALNSAGAVAGYYEDGSGRHAFIRDAHGSLTTFDVPGASATSATTIGPSGVVAGTAQKDGCALGFVRESSGGITTFVIPLTASTARAAEGQLEYGAKSSILAVSRPLLVRASWTFEYSLPAGSEVAMAIYDIAGRRMVELERGFRSAGWHHLSWSSSGVPRGIYFLRLRAGGSGITRAISIH